MQSRWPKACPDCAMAWTLEQRSIRLRMVFCFGCGTLWTRDGNRPADRAIDLDVMRMTVDARETCARWAARF